MPVRRLGTRNLVGMAGAVAALGAFAGQAEAQTARAPAAAPVAAAGAPTPARRLMPTRRSRSRRIPASSGSRTRKMYIARGNAVAIRGPSEMHADTLIAHYREASKAAANTGGNTEIYRVEAEGHVTLKRDTQTVVGDRADYDVDQAIAVVTGKASS